MYPCTSSGIISADGIVFARPCIIHSVLLLGSAAACTAIVYDNSGAAAGNVLAKAKTDPTLESTTHLHGLDVEANKGAYIALTGASASAIVYYSPL